MGKIYSSRCHHQRIGGENMTIFYYTTTGNSLSVARAFDGKNYSMVSWRHQTSFYEDDIIGFVFPCYRLSIPIIVENFLRDNHIQGKYVFAVITYGQLLMGAEKELQRIGGKYGVNFDYINKVEMIDNALNFFNMERQKRIHSEKRVEEALGKIVLDVKNRKLKTVQGCFIASFISRRGYQSYRRKIGACDQQLSIESHCNQCGVCLRVCPVQNIILNDAIEFCGKCQACFSCAHHCPQSAIRVSGEKSRERYRHPSISLEDIICSMKDISK